MPAFLNPALAWGLAAASVPVIIHLIHRRRFVRQPWAAMEWLLLAAKQNQRRVQMENLLLLLARTLAVALLALALTRPTFSDTPAILGTSQRTHLTLVMDTSASMTARSGTRTAFDEALTAASSMVAALSDDDPVAIVVTNDASADGRATGRPRMVLRETRDHGAARRRLGELRPAAARADLAEALKLVEEAVPQAASGIRRVAIVTDLQAVSAAPVRGDDQQDPVRSALERLRQKGVEAALVPVGRDVPNVAITSLRTAESRDVVQGTTAVFHAEVRNYGDRPVRVQVSFTVDGEPRGDAKHWVSLPARPAGSESPPAATAQFWTTFDEKDVGAHVLEAKIDTDALGLDDVRALAFTVRPRISVLAVDGDPSPESVRAPETFWLVPALAIRDGGPISVRRMTENEFRAMRSYEGYDVIVMANVGSPAPAPEDALRLLAFVQQGGALFLSTGDRVVASRWNDQLRSREAMLLPARLGPNRVDDQAAFRLDLSANRHPILADITDPGNAVFFESPIVRGFTTVEGLEGEKETRAVLRLSDLPKTPVLLERRNGKGTVLLLLTAVDDGWGTFPGSAVYPALLHECIYHATTRGDAERNLLCFQPWSRQVPANFVSMEVTKPDGSAEKVERDVGASLAGTASWVSFPSTSQPGVYRAVAELRATELLGQAPPPVRDVFAVNLVPSESDVRRITMEEAEARWRGLLSTGRADGAAAVAKNRSSEMAVPLIAAAILCLLAEVWLVQRIGRRRTSSSAASSAASSAKASAKGRA
ncbi:MAG: hypothetical protein HMLKMBBP_01261 [Planctomycetes bacterium]|nr:hypothetical protein [Planctomycetota bacterium]